MKKKVRAQPTKEQGDGGGDSCDAKGVTSKIVDRYCRRGREVRSLHPIPSIQTSAAAETPRRHQGDEGHRQGPLRGRQGHRRHHPRRPRRRRPPPQGLRHRGRFRQRALPQGPHPHPREARRLPPRPQATQPGCALPVHELGARARQARQPHLHPLHHLRPDPAAPRRRPALPHRARLLRHIRSRQQAQLDPLARLRRLPPQVHLRPRGRPPHHNRAPLRHQQERLGVRHRQEVPGRRRHQGHLPSLNQAARPRVDQGLQGRRILQGGNNV